VIRRENGILKRLRSTPLPPATYVTSLLVSTLIVFALQTVALFLLGRAFYGTPFPPDVGSFVATIMIGAAAFAALGTATASAIRSAEGSSAVVNFVLLPTAFLSGAFGPTRGYPAVLRAIGDVLPLTYFVKIVNAVYLHGHGFWTQPEAIIVLAAWGGAGLVFTIFRFRWEPRGR
jgi:ABC-2 type transport system permease protein